MSLYSRRFFCIFAGIFLLASGASANEQPYRVDKSRSPDGRIELWIKPTNGEGEAAGVAQIREVKTGQTLSTFDWTGFGVQLIAPDSPFAVLWRRDSRYFAIKFEETRGWTMGAIYGRGAKGQWVEVKMPSDEYTNAIKKMSGVSELYGKGGESPVEWARNGELVLEFVDRNLTYNHEDLEKEFLVTLKVADWIRRPLKTARIVSIKQRSK